MSQLADEAQITPDYLRKVELGFSRTVAPPIYARLVFALRIDDRRVLLADPWPAPDDEDGLALALGDAAAEAGEAETPPPESTSQAMQDLTSAHAKRVAELDAAELAERVG